MNYRVRYRSASPEPIPYTGDDFCVNEGDDRSQDLDDADLENGSRTFDVSQGDMMPSLCTSFSSLASVEESSRDSSSFEPRGLVTSISDSDEDEEEHFIYPGVERECTLAVESGRDPDLVQPTPPASASIFPTMTQTSCSCEDSIPSGSYFPKSIPSISSISSCEDEVYNGWSMTEPHIERVISDIAFDPPAIHPELEPEAGSVGWGDCDEPSLEPIYTGWETGRIPKSPSYTTASSAPDRLPWTAAPPDRQLSPTHLKQARNPPEAFVKDKGCARGSQYEQAMDSRQAIASVKPSGQPARPAKLGNAHVDLDNGPAPLTSGAKTRPPHSRGHSRSQSQRTNALLDKPANLKHVTGKGDVLNISKAVKSKKHGSNWTENANTTSIGRVRLWGPGCGDAVN